MMDTFWGPWQYPDIARLDGQWVIVERINPDRDIENLYRVSHSPPEYQNLFTFMPFGPFQSKSAMFSWLTQIADSRDPLYYSVFDKSHNLRVGMVSLLNIAPAHGRVEIGNIWYSPLVQKTKVNTEVTYLFLKTLFRDYCYRRVEWKCDDDNIASKRAALRMGFKYEGLFRQHMVVKGKNRDTAWYAMVDADWPVLEERFQAFLSGAVDSLARLNAQLS
jgi:RimJ/RimL family protein N-acetyltransferase